MRNELEEQIEFHYAMAGQKAMRRVEQLAKSILDKNDHLVDFFMGMGTWAFTDRHGRYIDSDPEVKAMTTFMDEWNRYLCLTGQWYKIEKLNSGFVVTSNEE